MKLSGKRNALQDSFRHHFVWQIIYTQIMTSSETLSALVGMLEYSSENVTVATLSSLQHVQGSKQQLDREIDGGREVEVW